MKTRRALLLRLGALAPALALALGGCGTIEGWLYGDPPRTVLRQIAVSSDPRANAGSATMLDIVFVYDAAAVAQLPKTGPDWFRQKGALHNRLATAIDIVSLQVPAGAPDFLVGLPPRASKAVGVFALANYLAEEGQPIANLTLWRRASIHLLPTTIAYSGN